jgi:hypothetical protein
MPELGLSGSVRGAPSNGGPYRELLLRASESMGNHDSNVVDAGRVG